MENNNNNRGVFPGNAVPQQGSIQTGPPVQGEQGIAAAQVAPIVPATTEATTNLSHHETLKSAPVEDNSTFMRLETKNEDSQVSGIIEVDLISFREKGQESRFLQVHVSGADADGNANTTAVSIGNEADFNKFKKFISQLNWND